MEPLIARMIDANFNRAREALRVMEDYARFGLGDAGLCAELKAVRHGLCAALQRGPAQRAIVMRDTPGDVGTEITAEGEYERVSGADVARAAGHRLSEALRVLEECSKTISAELATELESLRYGGYTLEKRLTHVVEARTRFGQVRLYVLITEELCRRPWPDVVRAVVAGGADCLQLREKGLSDGRLLERAIEFRGLCHDLGVLCIINDRPDIAVACGADGVHVGQDDLGVSAARRVVGPDRIVGVSTHTVEQARAAAAECPDYVAVGPMYSTAIKPQYPTAGPATLAAVRQHTALPLVAIGGITAENVGAVLAAGTRCVCVCSAVIAQDDPTAAASSIRRCMSGEVPPDGRHCRC